MKYKQETPDVGACAASRCDAESTVILTEDGVKRGLCDTHWKQHCAAWEAGQGTAPDVQDEPAAPRAQRKKRRIVTQLVQREHIRGARTQRTSTAVAHISNLPNGEAHDFCGRPWAEHKAGRCPRMKQLNLGGNGGAW